MKLVARARQRDIKEPAVFVQRVRVGGFSTNGAPQPAAARARQRAAGVHRSPSRETELLR